MQSISKIGSVNGMWRQLTSWTGYHQWSGQCHDEQRLDEVHDGCNLHTHVEELPKDLQERKVIN